MATAQAAIDRARDSLNDPAPGVTWSDAFLRRAATDGQRAVVSAVPRAYAVRQTLTLAANQAVQTLPAGASRLVKLIRNLGTDGSTVGRAITVADESQLDRVDPNWQVSVPKAAIRHYTYDKDVPGIFAVYPRPNAALQVDAVVSLVPAELSANADQLVVSDEFLAAVVQWMLAAAWQKNSPRRDPSKAAEARTAFFQLLGVKDQSDERMNPDTRSE